MIHLAFVGQWRDAAGKHHIVTTPVSTLCGVGIAQRNANVLLPHDHPNGCRLCLRALVKMSEPGGVLIPYTGERVGDLTKPFPPRVQPILFMGDAT